MDHLAQARALGTQERVQRLSGDDAIGRLDGAVLTVVNEVVVDESVKPERYAMSRIAVRAPGGPHE